MTETYTTIFRTGGTKSFSWKKCTPCQTYDAADKQAADIIRGGRWAMVYKTSQLNAIGIPTTYDAQSVEA